MIHFKYYQYFRPIFLNFDDHKLILIQLKLKMALKDDDISGEFRETNINV